MADHDLYLPDWIDLLGALQRLPRPSKKIRTTIDLVETYVLELTKTYELANVEDDEAAD